ncbi:hypothetical protein D2Q93_13935 [Alicyclobacillaceae bacterium I2511]|jgi:uncharacterized membrane protein YeaQ/YmgE (transglycosylase-associated protein family)|nr:hypothetical protein D2Q93_13935 [Alicyclobacillaceae bacterium I2511]
MLHLIAFVVIGLFIGWWFSRQFAKPFMAILLGLVGSLVGGFAVYYGFHGHSLTAKWGSLVVAAVIALILAVAGRGRKRT